MNLQQLKEMNELTAAVGLAQLERVAMLVNRRKEVAKLYDDVFSEFDFIIPQKVLKNHINTYWTYTEQYYLPIVNSSSPY